MNNFKFKNFRFDDFLRFLFTGCVLFIVIFNAMTLYKEIRLLGQIRQRIPYLFMGNKFLGLENILKDVKYIGYYTDKDMDKNQDALQFAQAQYILTPAILDLNNIDHPFVLFDCKQEETAMEKIKEAGLIPIKKNRFGIILARNLQENVKSKKPKLRVPLWDKSQSPKPDQY